MSTAPAHQGHPTSDGAVELTAGALRLALRADLGGSMAGFWHRGTPILRSTEPAQLVGARQSACYPLVPYSNRLGYKRFHWQGQDYTTETNFDDNPHSVHGVGWLRAWAVVSRGVSDALLGYRHAPDAHWPFAFEAQQRFTLSAHALTVALTFRNTAPVAQPVGLGWHPYFPKRARSHLDIALTDRWDSDATQLPVRRLAQPGIHGAVADQDFDHCFDGWTGAASIRDEQLALRLTSNLTHLVVYTPTNKPYFCVEPVSHVSDAIHRADPAAHGLKTLEPGEAFEATMTLEVAAT